MINLILIEIGMLLAFITGFILGGTKSANNILHPIETFKTNKELKEAKKQYKIQADDLAVTMSNIDNYDGSGNGQQKYKS